MQPEFDPIEVKRESERIIAARGLSVPVHLPDLDRSTPRPQSDVTARALLMHALLNLYFGAPVAFIREWITAHGLSSHLVSSERVLLAKTNEELTEQNRIDLYWYIEGIWTFLWAGRLVPELPYDLPVGDTMASFLPNLQKNESGDVFAGNMRLRTYEELFRMLDLYYRLHWYARDGNLRGYSTGDVSLDIIMERRKALEWILDTSEDWDHVQEGT